MATKIIIVLEDRHIEALCKSYGWTKTVKVTDPKTQQQVDADNPVSAEDFATSKVLGFIDEVAGACDMNEARDAAVATVTETLKTEVKAKIG